MSSARPGPMAWSRMSEKRLTGWFLSAATVVLPVLSVGVWQSAHPVLLNKLLPFAMDGAPPGVSGEGVGAARKRMKNANFSISLIASRGFMASVWVKSLGVVANWQVGVSSRSV